jgi:hypothetical protein
VSRLAILATLAVVLAGCTSTGGGRNFGLSPTQINDAIPGQRCVFLVDLSGESGEGPAQVTASSAGATTSVEHGTIDGTEVAEVTVIPRAAATTGRQIAPPWEGRKVTATIQAARDGKTTVAQVPINVTSETDTDQIAQTAAEVRDLFIPWLAANHPELGITGATQWQGTIVTPHILVVSHYLYFSDEWEMHVLWHVMIPPYDFARIELRRRFAETTPSLGFEIASRSATPVVVEPITPDAGLWR